MSSKIFWWIVLIILGVLTFYSLFGQITPKPTQVPISQVISEVQEDKVDNIIVEGDKLTIALKDEKKQVAYKESEAKLADYGITSEKVKIDVKQGGRSGILWSILYSFLPVLLIIAFFYWMTRQATVGNARALSFGETRARLFGPGKTKLTFADVAGLKEAKQELYEIVEFLKTPQKFKNLGAEIPRGVLLTGPAGTGKTLLAKAVAGEANVPFFSLSASEFVEMFVGVGASTSYDTKVLIRTKDSIRLMSIGEFVNRFYKNNKGGFPVEIKDVWTLGADWARGNKFFKSSSWKKVKSVYRHKVDKIYEIHFTGGKIEVTGDHSIFIRNKNHIICKRADELEVGDILLGLPYKVRSLFIPGMGTTHKIMTHQFPKEPSIKELTVWPLDEKVNNQIPLSISKALGWRYGGMILKTNDLTKFLPYKIEITPALMKLMGYYTAEGWHHGRSLKFGFGVHERNLHNDCINLMREIFNLKPHFYYTKNNALQIEYSSVPIARFFEKHCGLGAHNKHVPEILWDMPKEYFVSYLEGLVEGDGYINKRGMIEFSSCSEQLISELRWLLNMHGIPCSVTKYTQAGGRVIKNGKTPLPGSTYWRITVAKSINPFSLDQSTDFSAKPTIKRIIKKPYHGYVYDLCGCENEAFFGGEKPILLHNSRVRSTFQKAKRNAPSLIFIDELDAVGRVRGAGIGGGHDEREQTLNQILVEMDGFETDTRVVILASTNRPDILDPALLRPGRFDRKVVLDLPDIKEREDILKIHTQNKPMDVDADLGRLAKITSGFSGADLRNLANEAAILAARRDKRKITQQELEEAIEKVLLGPERKSHLLSDKERKITSYHESGHALVSQILPNCDKVHKVSIISRGLAAGYTWSLPTEDKKLHSKAEFLDNIASLLAGRAAEEIIFKDVTTGAQNDLRKATKIIRDMITQYGMSEKLGPATWGEKEELVFLGKELTEHQTYSEETASKIDEEVRKTVENAYQKAKNVLVKNKSVLEKVAEKLIKEEALEGAELEKLLKST